MTLNRNYPKVRFSYFLALPLILCTTISFGETIIVPTDKLTIQEAIDEATTGDIVLVEDGIYTGVGNKNLDFNGKVITVQSVNGPENCIIDCEGEGRGFYFHSGEEEDSVLSGFTIRNGNVESGCGILCSSSSPTITDCIITGSVYDLCEYGGGIKCEYSSPIISNCEISNNRIIGRGGGIYCLSSYPIISSCRITGNFTNRGGGIFNVDSSPIITDCTINNNFSYGSGGGIYNDNSSPIIMNSTFSGNNNFTAGGAIFNWDSSSLTIINCIFSGNFTDHDGAGIFNANSSLTISNCIFSYNDAALYSGKGGGGIFNDTSSVSITNCIFFGNIGNEIGGGGIYNDTSPSIITNCTFSENFGDTAGGGIYNENSSPTITNCLLWGNEAVEEPEIYNDAGSSPSTTFCDIDQDGYGNPDGSADGNGNIRDDPLFEIGPLGSFYLSHISAGQVANSPCIDAGSDTAENLDLDNRITRTDSVPDLGIVDMGYHYLVDSDSDGIPDDGSDSGVVGDATCFVEDTDFCDDNCPAIPNGPNLGTCYSWSEMEGACTSDADCGLDGSCSMNQEDADDDGTGDICDECTDTDSDTFGNPGFPNDCLDDNCPSTYNPNQEDADNDEIGDVCDECTDTDGDGYGNKEFSANICPSDNCPDNYNLGQEDIDEDDVGNLCDNCPNIDNTDQTDDDGDDIGNVCDNCPNHPNGSTSGTCTIGNIGQICTSHDDCGEAGFCSMNQEDDYPPDGNGIGDLCDCEADFECDGDVDGSDASTFKLYFGRSSMNYPCNELNPCNGDFDCDSDCDGSDAFNFKEDFGRSALGNPCPTCIQGDWCVYP